MSHLQTLRPRRSCVSAQKEALCVHPSLSYLYVAQTAGSHTHKTAADHRPTHYRSMEEDGPLYLLVSLRAGIMSLNATGELKAEPGKGLLSVAKSEDMLVHVLWQPRVGSEASGDPVHDLVVFPGECELKQIPGQARCYVLEFKDDPTRNMFFWSQQPADSNDAEVLERFNQAVNGMEIDTPEPSTGAPPAAAAPQGMAAGGSGGGNTSDLRSLLQGFFSDNPPSTTDASGNVNPNALAASLLAQMIQQQGGGKGVLRAPQQVDQGPGVHEVLKPDLLVPLLGAPGMLERLASHLPEEHRTQEHLIATIRSPQFQQQVATFSLAMQTGQLDLQQFGLQAKGFSVADFLTAVQEMVDKEKKGGAGGSS